MKEKVDPKWRAVVQGRVCDDVIRFDGITVEDIVQDAGEQPKHADSGNDVGCDAKSPGCEDVPVEI